MYIGRSKQMVIIPAATNVIPNITYNDNVWRTCHSMCTNNLKKKLYQMITMIIIAATVTDGLLHN